MDNQYNKKWQDIILYFQCHSFVIGVHIGTSYHSLIYVFCVCRWTCLNHDVPKKQIFKIMGMLSEEKKQVITTLGFGGLLRLPCREVRLDLCHWIITHYDVLYHCFGLGPHK